MASFGSSQFRDLIREFMERWCEDNIDSALCQLLKVSDDVDADVVGVTKKADGSITLTLDTSADPIASTDVSSQFGLFATSSDSWASAISASASSSYAAGDLSVSSVSTSTDGSNTSSASTNNFTVLVAVVVAIVAAFL
eukprot:TRINITY_DN8059_c0_g1_i6.p2 TRINITY_DN8059_c0_g1~~TRINITY_DN8059_c0_g1_i6.p2  ORF type:complete len:139 (-),score=53.04 TRINITY_DN8059_c0_g1_i6:34-450(-)